MHQQNRINPAFWCKAVAVMPPKKDAKKGAGAPKEIDPALYVRKPVELEDIPIDTSVFEQLAGKIANIDTLFPVWDDKSIAEEKWSEPVNWDTKKKTKYPKNLGITGEENLIKFFGLEPIEVAVDPKAKKEVKKDAKKGAVEAPVALTEVLVDEHGRRLPVIFMDSNAEANSNPEGAIPGSEDSHTKFEIQRDFMRAYTEEQMARIAQAAAMESASTSATENGAAAVVEKEEPKGGEIDPFVCGAYRIVQRFTPTICKALLTSLAVVAEDVKGAEEGIENERHILQDTFLWRSIYPKLPSGKPVYNPAGKYCVRLYLAGKWRKVYVDDTVPVTIDGKSALACSADPLELWPLLLSKAIYAVYSACGYSDVVADAMDQQDEVVPPPSDEGQRRPSAASGVPVHLQLCKAQCIAHFTSFAVHIMTGWQPRAPISIRKLFTQELTRSAKLLQSFSVEGVCVIDEDDIVRDRGEPTSLERILMSEGSQVNSATSIDYGTLLEGSSLLPASSSEAVFAAERESSSGMLDGAGDSDAVDAIEVGRGSRASTPANGVFDNDDEGAELAHIDEGNGEVSTVLEDDTPVIEPADDGIVRRTKKQFKAEYLRRKNYRDDVVAKIIERERRIAKITQALDQLLTEAFVLAIHEPVTQQTRILPVLGISYPSKNKTQLLQVQLLVNWRTSPPQETPFVANPTPEDPETEEVRGIEAGPLPLTTPLQYEWLTIQQLVDMNAFLVGLDTKMLTPFDTCFSNPWVPLSSLPAPGAAPGSVAVPDKAVAGKEKPAKGKGAAVVEAPVVEEYFADPGTLPVTLLRLNTSEFYTDRLQEESKPKPVIMRQGSSLSVSGNIGPLNPALRKVMRKGAQSEAEAALRDEQFEVDAVSRKVRDLDLNGSMSVEPDRAESGRVPVNAFLHFTVMIHADVVLEYKDDATPASTTENADGAPPSPTLKKARRMLPSDITLVLQEVRTDKTDPLMFVMDMKDHAYLPMVSKSFAISTKRLPADPDQPLIFWMRLFSRSSVCLHISSEVGVQVGPAEQIWAGIGKSVFLKEGYSEPTRNQTQQLVFRLPLVCDARSNADGSAESKGQEEDVGFAEPVAAKVATGMTFLHVTDRCIDRFVSIGMLPVDRTKPLIPLPRTQGNVVEFSTDPEQATVLLGRTFPAALFDKRAHSVPGFSWKLLVLSDDPIREPVKPINEEMVTQRYTGKFVANNKNALFRDIYTIDKLSFPLAFRLTTAHGRPQTGSAQDTEKSLSDEKNAFKGLASEAARKALRSALTKKGKRKEVCISVKMYRASDMTLVAEHKGRESVICYHQSLDKFLPDGEHFDVAAAVAAAAEAKANVGGKGAKAPAAKPGAKGAAPVTSDTVDVLIECTLDEDEMLISEDWLSRYPHVYDGLFPDNNAAHHAAAEAHEAAHDAKGKKGEPAAEAEDGVSKNAQVIAAQQKCLGIVPPDKTLIKWQLDVLAGKVVNISHDLRALEKEVALKNSWEEKSAGRSEKSAAALKYYQERRDAMKKLLEGSGSGDHSPEHAQHSEHEGTAEHKEATAEAHAAHGTGEVTHLTPTMVDSLGTALSSDVEQLKRRYTVLNNIPQIPARVTLLSTDENDQRLSFIKPRDTSDPTQEQDILSKLLAQRVSEGERGEARYQDVADRFVKLNSECRQQAKDRVDAIVKEANADAIELAKLWEAREKYRVYVEAQNAGLNYLLKRATDAKVVARAAEKKAADEAAVLAEKLRKEEEKKAGKKK